MRIRWGNGCRIPLDNGHLTISSSPPDVSLSGGLLLIVIEARHGISVDTAHAASTHKRRVTQPVVPAAILLVPFKRTHHGDLRPQLRIIIGIDRLSGEGKLQPLRAAGGQTVRAWCRQEEINVATYYRWERELLSAAEAEPPRAK